MYSAFYFVAVRLLDYSRVNLDIQSDARGQANSIRNTLLVDKETLESRKENKCCGFKNIWILWDEASAYPLATKQKINICYILGKQF